MNNYIKLLCHINGEIKEVNLDETVLFSINTGNWGKSLILENTIRKNQYVLKEISRILNESSQIDIYTSNEILDILIINDTASISYKINGTGIRLSEKLEVYTVEVN